MPEGPHSSSSGDSFENLLASAVQALELRGEQGLQEFLGEHQDEAQGVREGLERLRRLGVLAPPPAALVEPQQYGEFRVIRRLAAGGMGVVYLAEQTSLQRQVALKVVRPELLLSEHARERFRREVETIARLQHPGIVPILAVGTEGVVPWFAMEYIAGHTLDGLLGSMRGKDVARASGSDLRNLFGAALGAAVPGSQATGPFAGSYWETCVRLVLQVAVTMTYVHARGIVHRDLKPSNLVVTPQGQVMILDFGLAHVQDQQRLTKQEAQVGSPAYMAPEQVRGEAVDERVDVYGLGVVLYQLLATRLPFESTNSERLKEMILAGGARPVRNHNRSVPRDLDVVCQVAIDRERGRRYPSMAEFAADLEAVLARRSVRARPLGTAMRLVRACQRHPVWSITAAAALVVLFQFPLVLWWSQAAHSARLQAANDELERANAALTTQRTIAAADFTDARVAVDEMLSRIGHESLAATPGTAPLRRTILERSLELYQRLRQRHRDDARLRADASRATQYLGALLAQTGDAAAAEQRYREVLETLADSDDAEDAYVRGATGKLYGQLCHVRGRLDEAERLLRRGECDLEDAAARGGVAYAPMAVQRQLAEVHNSLALVRRDQGAREDELQLLQKAQVEKERLLAAEPSEMANALAFALGCSSLSRALLARDRRDEAGELIERGIAALGERRPSGAESIEFRSRLASLYDQRGSLRQDQERLAEAAADHGTALALRLDLYLENPSSVSHVARAGASYHNLAAVALAQRDREQSLACDEESIALLRSAVRMAPGVREYAQNLEYALVGRCGALAGLARYVELAAAVDELAAAAVSSDGMLNAARLRSLLADKAPEQAPGAAGQARAAELRGLAADLVGKAVDLGFADAAHFTTKPFARYYKPLQGLPAFDLAMARIARAKPGAR